MSDKKVSSEPFVDTSEHQAFAKAGILVITPTMTVEEVKKILDSPDFEKALAAYNGA